MNPDPGPKTADDIIMNLHNFNRKERDHLMKFALSDFPSHPEISSSLWKHIAPEGLGTRKPDHRSMFVGMDYHLNWLFAALKLSNAYEQRQLEPQKNKWPKAVNKSVANSDRPIQGNQEDVDLLVAFPGRGNLLYLILIEAKLGSGWSSKQFQSKVSRLKALKKMTDSNSFAGPAIEWRFVLASPRKDPPAGGDFHESRLPKPPSWASVRTDSGVKPHYIQFGPQQLFQVKRCSESGEEWEIIRVNLAGKAKH